jgi:hypothetical protein
VKKAVPRRSVPQDAVSVLPMKTKSPAVRCVYRILRIPQRFASKLQSELLALHNHVLTTFLNAPAVEFDTVFAQRP